jgi:hypothetical protein
VRRYSETSEGLEKESRAETGRGGVAVLVGFAPGTGNLGCEALGAGTIRGMLDS